MDDDFELQFVKSWYMVGGMRLSWRIRTGRDAS